MKTTLKKELTYRQLIGQAFAKLPKERQCEISRRINVSVSNIKGMVSNLNQVRTDKLDLLVEELNIQLTAKPL